MSVCMRVCLYQYVIVRIVYETIFVFYLFTFINLKLFIYTQITLHSYKSTRVDRFVINFRIFLYANNFAILITIYLFTRPP